MFDLKKAQRIFIAVSSGFWQKIYAAVINPTFTLGSNVILYVA